MCRMNHFKLSLIKSILRISGSIITGLLLFIDIKIAILVLALSYGVAEILGILEEIFDKRKENN